MINKETIDKILESINIIELVSEYVTLTRQGKNYKGICPSDNCKEEAFVVAPEKNLIHCFCCGKGGNPAHFLMDLKQIKYEEALLILKERYMLNK